MLEGYIVHFPVAIKNKRYYQFLVLTIHIIFNYYINTVKRE